MNQLKPTPMDFKTTAGKKAVWNALGDTIGAPKFSKIGIDGADTLVYSADGQEICGSTALQCLGFSEEAARIAMQAVQTTKA